MLFRVCNIELCVGSARQGRPKLSAGTTVADIDCTYDRIFIIGMAFEDYAKEWGVYRFDSMPASASNGPGKCQTITRFRRFFI